jgi:hypothetical protein
MPSPMGIRVVPRIGDELKVIERKKNFVTSATPE